MSELKILLDDDQVDRLRSSLSRPPASIWSSDNLLRVVQILAIVVGGCWVLVQFLLYQRDEIALRRMDLVQSVELKRMESELSDLKLARSAHEVNALTTYRFKETGDLSAIKIEDLGDGNSLYKVTYSTSIENTSNAEFEVSLWILDSFIGIVSEQLLESSQFVEAIGFPADRWNPGANLKGAVIWKAVKSIGTIYPEAIGKIASPWNFVVSEVELRRGGGLVGTLKPSQNYLYEETFLVKAPTGAYVCFIVSYCFQRCNENDDLFNLKRYTKLPENMVSEEKPTLPNNSIQPTVHSAADPER